MFLYCTSCEYRTTRKDTLKAHIRSKHERSVIFYCTWCVYQTTWISGLKRHMEAIHEWSTSEQQCEWQGCMRTTKGPKRMSAHVRQTHKFSPGPFFACPACGKVFRTTCAKKAQVGRTQMIIPWVQN